VESYQTTIRIGYVDSLMAEEGDDVIILRREESDAEGKIESDFLDLLLERQKKAENFKKRLLSPIFEELSRYKACHFDFYASKGIFCPNLCTPKAKTEAEPDGDDSTSEEDDDDLESHSTSDYDAAAAANSNACTFCDPFETDRDYETRVMWNKEIVQSWENSLFGKLEARLNRLKDRFLSMAFNGSRYAMDTNIKIYI
jgi:hypothetical protein